MSEMLAVPGSFLYRLCLSRREVLETQTASAVQAENKAEKSEENGWKEPAPRPFKVRRIKESKRRDSKRDDSEDLAQCFVKAGDITEESVLRVLHATDIPLNTARKNILPDGTTAVRGMLLGFYSLAGNVGITDASKSRPWLVRLLANFARKSNPDFEFTSIQVNKNYASRPHVDKNNLGESLIIGLGDYTGGDVWVHDEGTVAFELKEDISCMYHYEAGATYHGSWMDIRGKWTHFNGNRLHFTQPFQGDRFSLVYFTCSRYLDASVDLSNALFAAGFPFSRSSQKLAQEALLKKEEHQKCQEKWKQEIRDRILRAKTEAFGRCQARTWNRGWGGQCPHFKQDKYDDFCKGHFRSWKTHGRIDGPVPQLKKAEMLKFQKQMVAAGEKPPDPLPHGAIILLDCGNSDNA